MIFFNFNFGVFKSSSNNVSLEIGGGGGYPLYPLNPHRYRNIRLNELLPESSNKNAFQ